MIIDVSHQPEKHSVGHMDSYMRNLCEWGKLKDIKEFLSNPEYKDYLRSLDFAMYLTLASKKNHLPVVKWLLTDSLVKQYVNINTTSGRPLEVAIIEKHNKIVKFMLHSTALDKHADPYIENDKLFFSACASGNLEAVKILLNIDKNLQKTIENQNRIQKKLEVGFLEAYQAKEQEVLEYILLDIHLNPSNKIYQYLKDYSSEEKNKVFSYFQNRDLNEKLHRILPINKKQSVKSKI